MSAPEPVYLITGDRDWGKTRVLADGTGVTGRDDLQAMVAVLEQIPRGSIMVSGGAQGADRMAETQWRYVVRGPVISVPYFSWMRRSGGPVRNRFMLRLLGMFRDLGHFTYVLGFHRSIETSRGTGDMLTIAHDAGFPHMLYPGERSWPGV